MSDTVSGADLLARIKPKLREESTQLIMDNELLDQWTKLQEELAESRDKDMSGNRLSDGQSAKTKKLAKKVAELEEEIAAGSPTFVFRAVSKDKWRALCDSNPPRKNDIVDAHVGYNRDAVLDQAVRMCMISPVFDDCAKMLNDEDCEAVDPESGEVVKHFDCGSWQQFEAVCNPNEWQELVDTVNSVNRGVVDAPKSALASRILGKPGTT